MHILWRASFRTNNMVCRRRVKWHHWICLKSSIYQWRGSRCGPGYFEAQGLRHQTRNSFLNTTLPDKSINDCCVERRLASRSFHTNARVSQGSIFDPCYFGTLCMTSPISSVPNFVFMQMTQPFTFLANPTKSTK